MMTFGEEEVRLVLMWMDRCTTANRIAMNSVCIVLCFFGVQQ
jgi:hypothetical protein